MRTMPIQIEINGRRINASIEGAEGAPVVTLSHSLAAHLDMWRPQMPALTERFRVLRYDVRGHGSSSLPDGNETLKDLADDVVALLITLGISRTHFVGLSMGGMIGQQLAVDHPEFLESLVLADTLSAYGADAQPMWQGRIDAASTPLGLEPLVEPTVTRWFTEAFRVGQPETIEWVRGMIRATSPAGFIACSRALMALNLTAKLPQVRIPTLVLVGRQDPTTPVAGAEVIAAALSDARLAVIEDAAHLSNIEQPDVFTRLLMDFLIQQPNSGLSA